MDAYMIVTYDRTSEGNYIYYVDDSSVLNERTILLERGFSEISIPDLNHECNVYLSKSGKKLFHICKVDSDYYNGIQREEIQKEIDQLQEKMERYK